MAGDYAEHVELALGQAGSHSLGLETDAAALLADAATVIATELRVLRAVAELVSETAGLDAAEVAAAAEQRWVEHHIGTGAA